MPSFWKFWSAAKGKAPAQQLQSWQSLYVQPNENVFRDLDTPCARHFSSVSLQKDYFPALSGFVPEMRRLEDSGTKPRTEQRPSDRHRQRSCGDNGETAHVQEGLGDSFRAKPTMSSSPRRRVLSMVLGSRLTTPCRETLAGTWVASTRHLRQMPTTTFFWTFRTIHASRATLATISECAWRSCSNAPSF